jgi:thymidine phosphorylase
VSLEFHRRIGDRVAAGEKLVTIHYNAEAKLAEAKELITASFVFGEAAPAARRLIRQVLGA